MLISKHSWDYFPSTEQPVFHMPRQVHERVLRSLCTLRINEQLWLLSREPGQLANFASHSPRDRGSEEPLQIEHAELDGQLE
jgi:hypothetical protein